MDGGIGCCVLVFLNHCGLKSDVTLLKQGILQLLLQLCAFAHDHIPELAINEMIIGVLLNWLVQEILL